MAVGTRPRNVLILGGSVAGPLPWSCPHLGGPVSWAGVGRGLGAVQPWPVAQSELSSPAERSCYLAPGGRCQATGEASGRGSPGCISQDGVRPLGACR